MNDSSYRFMTAAITASGYLRVLKWAVGAFCLSMAVLGTFTLFHPLGPHSDVGRALHVVLTLSAIPVGLGWLFGRWPTFGRAVAFMVWADIAVAIAAVVASSPEARIVTMTHMCLLGVFASFLMGTRVLAAHCAFACAVLLAVAGQAVFSGERTWSGVYMFLTPILVAVVIMPIAIQAVIEGGRRAVARTARQALRDPMTGLCNRRGMYEFLRRAVIGRGEVVLVAAAIDLDRFKQLNDERGHQYGDEAIRAVAAALRSSVRSGDIAARLGGDEFAVIAAMDTEEGIRSFTERMRSAMTSLPDSFTASVGVASVAGKVPDVNLVDDVLRHADRALYEAKSQGGNRMVCRAQTGPDLSHPH